MNVLAVIPARGGSKGLPRKNVIGMAGIPLIAYSVLAAIRATCVTRVICSTDDEEIAKIANEYGAEVPFRRPSTLAQDHSTDLEVFTHLVEYLRLQESYEPDFIVQLRPTSPLRKNNMIDEAVNLLSEDPSADSLRSVSIPPITPYKMWTLTSEGSMNPLLTLDNNLEPYNTLRQELPDVYVQTGTIDVTRISTIIAKKSMTGNVIKPYIIESEYCVDIDAMENLYLAEVLLDKLDCIRP